MQAAIHKVTKPTAVTVATAAAMALAGLVLVLGGPAREAEASYPGQNGKIAFASNRTDGEGANNPEGDFEIFTAKLDGTGLQELTRNTSRELHPDYAPNGRKIAFVSERNFGPGIYTMNSDGTKQKKRTRSPATVFQFPSFSPDGERIAFMSNQGGPEEIHVMDADGSEQKRLTRNGAPDDAPSFRPRVGG